MLEATMSQLLERKSEAEHAIKDLEMLYTQTMVQWYNACNVEDKRPTP